MDTFFDLRMMAASTRSPKLLDATEMFALCNFEPLMSHEEFALIDKTLLLFLLEHKKIKVSFCFLGLFHSFCDFNNIVRVPVGVPNHSSTYTAVPLWVVVGVPVGIPSHKTHTQPLGRASVKGVPGGLCLPTCELLPPRTA